MGHPGPPPASPFILYLLLETLIPGERPQKDSATSTGQKLQREKELSGMQISVGEISSRRGEIITINTIIKLDFIGIIIILTTISTSTIITTPSRCNNCVESCIVLRGNFLGVNYFCS